MFDRGEQRAIETAREEEPNTGQEGDVDPKVLRKLKDTIVQRDNEISILASNGLLHSQMWIQILIPIPVVGSKVCNLNMTLCSVKICT